MMTLQEGNKELSGLYKAEENHLPVMVWARSKLCCIKSLRIGAVCCHWMACPMLISIFLGVMVNSGIRRLLDSVPALFKIKNMEFQWVKLRINLHIKIKTFQVGHALSWWVCSCAPKCQKHINQEAYCCALRSVTDFLNQVPHRLLATSDWVQKE